MENLIFFYDFLNINPFDNYFTAYIITYFPLLIFGQIVFLPWNIAWARRHPSAWGILIVNLISWTFIAWIIALIWATSQIEQRVIIKD